MKAWALRVKVGVCETNNLAKGTPMPSHKALSHFVLLPDLVLKRKYSVGAKTEVFEAEKARTACEICTRCATPSSSVYDHRTIMVKDEPIRGHLVRLKIKKRRYYCRTCRKPFSEPIEGIMPKRRTTQRYRRSLLWAAMNFQNLSKVRNAYRCSNGLIGKVLYEQLELKSREMQNPWNKRIGIDEHCAFKRGQERFVTVVTDMKNRRIRELVHGKTGEILKEKLKHIPGRENVQWVALDLSDSYKKFVFEFFPNAQIVADKFHVLRLLNPHLIRRRKDISNSRMSSYAKRLLTKSSKNLDYFERSTIWKFLEKHPDLLEVYAWKERMHGFYRIKGYNKARRALTNMILEMQNSKLPEIKTLRRTLDRWSEEILNYFRTRLTNARTEGFNNVAKLVIRQAYGYKSFRNYRLRLLSTCAF